VKASTRSAFRVVHSSSGRLRVHVPDASGVITEQLRQLPGVLSATTNVWTQNILILFDPRGTTEQNLLETLPSSADASPPKAVPVRPAATVEPPPALDEIQPVGYVTGFRGRLYRFFGWTSLGLAFVGAVTPGIPTVPFLLVASYFFIRSSPKTHAWLLKSRWSGGILRDWEERRGVSRSLKWTGLGLIAVGMVFTVLLDLPLALVASILALEVIGIIIVARLRVVEPVAPSGVVETTDHRSFRPCDTC
jgi:uncharacterized protein